MKDVTVIGSGFAGLASATTLASHGFNVRLLDKNSQVGGRASQHSEAGFIFDKGPSWYWMPDVFEQYFNRFGKHPSDYYDLVRLSPSYRVFWEKDFTDIPADLEDLKTLFESWETGSAHQLDQFLREAEHKYRLSMQDLVYKPGLSPTEYAIPRLLGDVFSLSLFKPFNKYIRSKFRDPRILSLLEFPVLFLGAKPSQIPSLYSLMNYADMKLGTWYPMGGFHEVAKGMAQLAREMGVSIELDTPVNHIDLTHNPGAYIHANGHSHHADVVVAGADYHHVDQHLLDPEFRNYNATYWNKRVLSPSSLLFFVGLNRKVPGLRHHNLFFDADFEKHTREIYDQPSWPEQPLFYVCAPSVTDPSVASPGHENLFILVPVAPGLDDTEETRERYYDLILDRLEKNLDMRIRGHEIYKRSYAHNDFKHDYNSFKGNAYGLANTLKQTAFLRPSIRNKKARQLYYTGQLTVPGPGVPPSLISGQIVADEIAKTYKQ
ncbi:MAG: phytoene desaturase [Flavobacteriales bacterium]|nr:phytoene desaturase [Flavobacteriales bacterium]